jgi:hypothetical protein
MPNALPYRFQTQPHRQILPVRVVGIDQINLSLPMPVFQLLLAQNSRLHLAKQFVMNKAIHAIIAGKTTCMFIAMLIHALQQIRRNANVHRAVKAAGKDIDAGLFFFSHMQSLTAKWTLKQVQGDGIFYNQGQYHIRRHPEFISGSIRSSTIL